MKPSEIPVFILVGGKGSRLASVTKEPKPLVEVAGRPFIHYLLAALCQQGFQQIFFLSGYKADIFESALTTLQSGGDDAALAQLSIRFLAEETPMGTGGALRGALPFIKDMALVLNGDSFCEVDYNALLSVLARPEVEFVLAAVLMPDAGDYGALALGTDGKLSGFQEKGSNQAGWINAGVYGMTHSWLEEAIPNRSCSLEREILPDQVAWGSVWTYQARGIFHDIGTPERLAAADKVFSQPGFLGLE